MDYSAGFVARQVHEVNLLGAEQRIAHAQAAAEREAEAPAAGRGGRRVRAPHRRFHLPLFAR
ncbi:hypothetical protein GCM10017608_02800 [Agromyces luteolus]|uniref:Uncharacterized protein n=1 Tax=Agromyces luteolus TaxID=88373 RepID=A0A7C9LU39_9MICO|nr:hypothetical protein [Agromyces luteolus]MUN05799.1 hypothetical protein [Agromyces luteolus]GLK26348.1 hypothetical protein GCM10017608_02800 [Agromyces luteolus]